MAWFRKWGGMTSKQRFDAISYIETTVKAFEAIEDELDHFMTFAVWEEKKQAARWSDERILKEWTAIVESQRDECLWRRNQWLIPRFEGVHRIKRQRTSQEIMASRHASITDSSQIGKLWSAGEASLQQFGASIQATVANGTHVEGPSLHVRAGDQPVQLPTRDVIFGDVEREVVITEARVIFVNGENNFIFQNETKHIKINRHTNKQTYTILRFAVTANCR